MFESPGGGYVISVIFGLRQRARAALRAMRLRFAGDKAAARLWAISAAFSAVIRPRACGYGWTASI
jgi:hypothetical protein